MSTTAFKWLNAVRPVEWALLAYVLFVLSFAGPSAFGGSEVFFSRSSSILTALGVMVWVQGFIGFLRQPWPPEAPRGLVWLTLPLAMVPWGFATWLALTSRAAAGLPSAEPAVALAAGFSLFISTLTVGLPTMLLWLLWARHTRADAASFSGVRATLRQSARVLRDWLPLLIIISSYGAVNAQPAYDYDDFFARVDRLMFLGRDPQGLIQPLLRPWLSEVLAFVYSFYALLFPLVLSAIFAAGGRVAIQRAAFTIGLTLLIAYASYELIPVKGPVLSRTFEVPLDLYLIAPLKEAMMDRTRITWDCFPSLHTACTLLMAEAAWKWARRLFWVISPAVVLMPLACVYLRYHYVADIIAGALLAAVMVALTNRHFSHRPAGYQ